MYALRVGRAIGGTESGGDVLGVERDVSGENLDGEAVAVDEVA